MNPDPSRGQIRDRGPSDRRDQRESVAREKRALKPQGQFGADLIATGARARMMVPGNGLNHENTS